MNAAVLRTLALADARLLGRDPLLKWLLGLPFGLALLFRVLIPRVQEALMANGFDIVPYFPLVMGGYLMTAPGIVGMVIGFLLLDERDARPLGHCALLHSRCGSIWPIASCRHWSSEPHRRSWGIR